MPVSVLNVKAVVAASRGLLRDYEPSDGPPFEFLVGTQCTAGEDEERTQSAVVMYSHANYCCTQLSSPRTATPHLDTRISQFECYRHLSQLTAGTRKGWIAAVFLSHI